MQLKFSCLTCIIVGTANVQLVLPKLLTNIGTLKAVIENKFRGRGRRGQDLDIHIFYIKYQYHKIENELLKMLKPTIILLLPTTSLSIASILMQLCLYNVSFAVRSKIHSA